LPPAVKGPFSSADFVWFIRVKDSAKASAKVSAGIDRVATLAREHNQAMMLADVPDLEAEGFRSITHPLLAMQGLKFIVGVTDDHLVIGNSAEAINACLSVAAGKSPSIRENPRFIAEGLVPEGAVYGASFHDLSNLGQEMASGFFMAGMFGQMIPENEETRPLKAMIGILGRLSPVVGKIDFFSSSATVCTLEGSVWKTRQVMNYKPLPAAPPSPPTAKAAAGGAPGE
ncbi:MAG: hypothetical protein GY842_08325, partial [bacterium]|nr:hypothetical protein [bacterium]